MELNLKQKLFVTTLMIIGAVGGLMLLLLADKYGLSIGQVIYLLICLVINYNIATVIHESGHLVAGLLSGYEFVSFRIWSITFIKENGKLKRKHFDIVGTSGQCLMMPPDIEFPANINFTFYLLGGGLFNLITAIILIPVGMIFSSFYLSIPFVTLGIISLFQCLINLIPLNIQVPNDGYNIYLLINNVEMRAIFYQQLRINGLMYQGFLPSEIPKKLYETYSEQGVGYLIRAALYIDKKDFLTAQDLISKALKSKTMIDIYNLEAKSELLFCKIMNKTSKNEIDSLFDDALKKYISISAKTQISKRRILYAYYIIYLNDYKSANQEYELAMHMRATYPNIGEMKSELSLIEYIKNHSDKHK